MPWWDSFFLRIFPDVIVLKSNVDHLLKFIWQMIVDPTVDRCEFERVGAIMVNMYWALDLATTSIFVDESH